MAKIIVKIDIHNMSVEELKAHLERYRDDWFPLEDKGLISVDDAYLKLDPTEDSFRVFEFVGVEEGEAPRFFPCCGGERLHGHEENCGGTED